MKAPGKQKKPKFTTAPKRGKEKMAGANMGNIFATSPKKPGADMPVRKMSERGARMKRLQNRFI